MDIDVPGKNFSTTYCDGSGFVFRFVGNNFINLKLIIMNKGELIDAMANGAKISKADASRALDAAVSSITTALKKGGRLALVGFGTFSVSKRAARNGRNPQTGKTIKIAAKKVAKFKAGSELAKAVNK